LVEALRFRLMIGVVCVGQPQASGSTKYYDGLEDRLARLLTTIPLDAQREGLSLSTLQASLRGRWRGNAHPGEIGRALRRLGFERRRAGVALTVSGRFGVRRCAPSQPSSLRDRFTYWYRSLPAVSRERRFSMTEFEAALKTQGEYISPALLELGWRRKRIWSTTGQYHRYWEPPLNADC
jgi:hypothetical protein